MTPAQETVWWQWGSGSFSVCLIRREWDRNLGKKPLEEVGGRRKRSAIQSSSAIRLPGDQFTARCNPLVRRKEAVLDALEASARGARRASSG